MIALRTAPIAALRRRLMSVLMATGAVPATSLAILLAHAPAQAQQQVDDGIVLNIMRECARIDDPTSRLACYDNNIRAAGANPRGFVPGQGPVVEGGPGAAIQPGGVGGFGGERVRTPERFQAPAGQVDEIAARVARVEERQPGVYTITLEDGAEWQFAESVNRTYRVPRRGQEVVIGRAALGSFLLRFEGQAAVRVRRIR